MNDSSVSVPDPAHISFPWTESNKSVSPSANINSVQINLPVNKAISEMTIAPNVTCLERRRPNVSPVLRIENSNNKSIDKEVCQCETEKSRTHDPACAGDHEGSRRKQIFHRSTECRRYPEVRGCKSAILPEDYTDEVKSRHMFGALDVNRSFDDQTDTVPESPVTARIPSPSSASSVTSGRRLEWDSGADVGYQFVEDLNLHSGASLSTIERIALAHGRSTGLFERLDSEGVCGPPKPVLGLQLLCCELDSPVAKSTPIYKSGKKTSSECSEKGPMATVVEPPETVLPGGYLYLHSPEEFGNEMTPLHRSRSESQSEDSTHGDKVAMSDSLNKKNSNSLVNLSSSCEEVQSSVPRSKSYLNLLDKDNENVPHLEAAVHPSRVLAGTCSVSSSSVATIVQRPIFPTTSDKFIQTPPLKLSVGVQVSESMEYPLSSCKISELSCDVFTAVPAVKDETKNQKGKINSDCNVSQNHRCNGAHKKGSVRCNCCQNYQFQASNSTANNNNNNNSEKSSEKVQIKEKDSSQAEEFHTSEKGTLDSAASCSQTVESCAGETSCSGSGLPRGTSQGSPDVADCTNSFEYLPGHVFDKASKHLSDASKQSFVCETSANKAPLKSDGLREMIERSDSRSSSLSKDIEEGVDLLQKLMSEKSYNGKTKKKLIRLIVNKLVNTDYPANCNNEKQFQTVPLSRNVPWVPATQSVANLKTLRECQYLNSGERKSVQSFNTCSSSERSKDRTIDSVSEIHSSPSSCTPSGSVSVPGDNEQSQGETTDISNIYESSRKDWNTPTSQTEEDYAANRAKFVKSSSPTPPLLHLCKSEHEKQLQWIRFEIDHLSQLKQLLEKQESTKSRSHLADHEHKFHKIKPANKNCSHKSEIQRPKANGNDDWRNNMVKNDSSRGNASLKTCSSSSLGYQEPLTPHIYHHSRDPKGQSQERGVRKMDKKKDLSTQTLSLHSYILHSDRTNSGLKGINSDDGQLNVYVQTSPKGLERHKKAQHEFPTAARISESARKSYESAVKCCCDCRKALKELMNEKDDRVQMFCRCESASSESDLLTTDVSYSTFDCSDSATLSHSPESNNKDVKHLPQKREIATETVVNKTVQTTPSLNNMPIIKPIWIHENSRNSSQKARGKFCPCCGLREKPYGPSERLHDQDKAKKKNDPQSEPLFVDERGKHHTISDASVQTNNKEPLAYLLTFEPTCKENIRTRNNDMLPEIKLLVPVNPDRLENEMKRKASNLSTFKENQCPPNPVRPNEQDPNPYDPLPQEGEGQKMHKLTLQEYLRANRPDYIQHADKRSQCLADLALLRDLRKQKRLELLGMTEQAQNEKPKDELSDERIVFSCAAVSSKPKLASPLMREQSRRKYHKTREIQNKFVEKKKKEDFKTNRLMAELFTKKLQKKVLQGVVNHSSSASIISSVN